MGANGVNGSGDLSGIIEYYDNYITEKTAEKKEAYENCDAAEKARDGAYENYMSIYSKKEESDFAKKQLQKQIDQLRFDMKMAMANASKQGKSSAEISAIEQNYMTRINRLNGSLYESTQGNLSFAEKVEKAKNAYINSRFDVNSADAGLLGILRSLFTASLDKGKFEQQQIVNDSINKNIDLMG